MGQREMDQALHGVRARMHSHVPGGVCPVAASSKPRRVVDARRSCAGRRWDAAALAAEGKGPHPCSPIAGGTHRGLELRVRLLVDLLQAVAHRHLAVVDLRHQPHQRLEQLVFVDVG